MENEHWSEFVKLKDKLGLMHKTLAIELGISASALTERLTGRAHVRRETILAMRYLAAKNGL